MARKDHEYKASHRRTRSVFPMSMRSPLIPQYLGGSFGYRGGNWKSARKAALKHNNYISNITGFPADFDTLVVDHIYPYRIGGKTEPKNLRITNLQDNPAVDNIKGFQVL